MENQINQEPKWIHISDNRCLTFQLGEEPEVIHVIKTGFRDRYMVVHEDAYELSLGHVEFCTEKELNEEFKVDISQLNG